MSIQNAEAIGRNPNGPLSSTYPTYKDMYDNNVIYAYKGIVTSDLVTHVLSIMEERLEEVETAPIESNKLSKKVFNVMVESMNNLYADEVELAKDAYDPTAMLLVKQMGKHYTIITGSQIPKKKVGPIKQLVDRINRMSAAELKSFYQETLDQGQDDTGVTLLGILDLARKSKNELGYAFKYLNPEYSFFSLEARITQNTLQHA